MDVVERLRALACEASNSEPWMNAPLFEAGEDFIDSWSPTLALAALDAIEALGRLRMAYAEAAGQPADADTFWRHIRDADAALAAFEKAAGEHE